MQNEILFPQGKTITKISDIAKVNKVWGMCVFMSHLKSLDTNQIKDQNSQKHI